MNWSVASPNPAVQSGGIKAVAIATPGMTVEVRSLRDWATIPAKPPNSAINTFVRGLFGSDTAPADTRTYSEFTLSSVVNDTAEAELAVSETGVLSFTAQCSVYSPCAGQLTALNGNAETGYTVEIKHSEHFSSIISGLDYVYAAEGEKIRSNIPLGYSDGNGEIRVMFYSDGSLLNCLTVNENTLAWS